MLPFEKGPDLQLAYMPTMLNSISDICKALGVGSSTVRQWVQEGAPIAVERERDGTPVRYRCELMRLYLWLERKKG